MAEYITREQWESIPARGRGAASHPVTKALDNMPPDSGLKMEPEEHRHRSRGSCAAGSICHQWSQRHGLKVRLRHDADGNLYLWKGEDKR